jgi:hypothetical protein
MFSAYIMHSYIYDIFTSNEPLEKINQMLDEAANLQRLQSNKNTIHQLWHQKFEQIPVMNTRLIIGN